MPQEPVVLNQDLGETSSQSPPQIDHHCCYVCGNSLDGIFCQRCTCKSCRKGAYYGYNFLLKVPIIFNPEPCHDQNVEEFPQTLPSFHPTCYSGDENSFAYDSTPNLVKDSPNVFNPPSQPLTYSNEFCGDDAHYSYDYIIISKLPSCIAITLVVSTKDSLIMGDEHLDTIPEKESDEFIKSSVENLVPNPSKSEDERECDVSACDDFTTFSNLLFDADHDFSSSDNDLFFDEDIPKEIYNLCLRDSLIISSLKIDSLLDEFVGELILLKSIPPGIDEADYDLEEEIHLIEKLLYDNSSTRPTEEFISENSDAAFESFSPSHILIEDSDSLRDDIDLSLTPDDSMPPGIKNYDYDSEGDILILEELLSNDSFSLPENESFHFDIPSSPRPPAKPPDDGEIKPNSKNLTVRVVGDIFEHYVPMPRLLPTQPTHASNQEKSPHLLSHGALKLFSFLLKAR
uniref:Reverse transcriptase domain-containing protein n=1 Tax=Tanacetum cinerariifolium TaxID=118510 RepID=A0A6L2KZ30_TANCI|nr:hypothetical protein [Tanacetum cinerariifolium]